MNRRLVHALLLAPASGAAAPPRVAVAGPAAPEPAFVETGMTSAELSVTIYETTTDASQLTVDRWHLFLNFDQEGLLQVVEVVIVSTRN